MESGQNRLVALSRHKDIRFPIQMNFMILSFKKLKIYTKTLRTINVITFISVFRIFFINLFLFYMFYEKINRKKKLIETILK